MSNNFSAIKSRLLIYPILVGISVCIFFYTPILNHIQISTAEKCFASKNYICAFNSYKKAFASGINNSQYVPHYVETLSKVKKITLVQKELSDLMIHYPNSPAIEDIEMIFEQLKTKIEKTYSDNYISNAVQGTSIVHWNVEKGPIDVYINTKNAVVPERYVTEIKKAFDDYQKVTNNKLRFYYVKNEDEADIIILFTQDISGGKCAQGEQCAKVLGLTENNITGNILHKSTVKLRTEDADNSEFTANQIHNIAKHEIGHALGITGHSFDSTDVMYPVSNDAKWAENAQVLIINKKEFSKRDIETIELLYKIVPDITNRHYDVAAYPDMYYPIAVLGTKKQIGEKKLEEATTYADTISNNFVAQMNLAESYFGNRNYAKAKETFENALSVANTDEEKFTVYHNLAVIYYEAQDYDNAISHSDLANSYSNGSKEMSSDDIKAYCYIEKKDYEKAQELLEKQITITPANIALSAALTGVYIKRFQLGKAIDEMKRIKKINPDALKDTSFRPYQFFANFT